MGIKERNFSPLPRDISLEDLVPKDNFYRRLESDLDLSFVREMVASLYSGIGRPSVGPQVFFREVFGVLSDPKRARIVYALSIEELCVCDVAAVAGLSVSAASHQLKRLRDRGVAEYRREGRMAFYRLADEHVRGLLQSGVGFAREEAALR